MSKEQKVSPKDMEKEEKIEAAKLTLKMMGLKPEDLVTLPAISLELKLQLDYDPQQENPVKLELIQVESVTDKSRQFKLTINDIREFIKNKAGNTFKEIVTERYFGYRWIGNPRRYVILIEERSDNKVAISIDKKEILENLHYFQFIEVEKENKSIDKYFIYVFPTPEDDIKFSQIIREYQLDNLFEHYKGVRFSVSEYKNSLNFLSQQLAYPDGLEIENHLRSVEERLSNNDLWAERYENIINANIPEELIKDLQALNSISLSQENSRFPYLLTWIIPIQFCKNFLEDLINYLTFVNDF